MSTPDLQNFSQSAFISNVDFPLLDRSSDSLTPKMDWNSNLSRTSVDTHKFGSIPLVENGSCGKRRRCKKKTACSKQSKELTIPMDEENCSSRNDSGSCSTAPDYSPVGCELTTTPIELIDGRPVLIREGDEEDEGIEYDDTLALNDDGSLGFLRSLPINCDNASFTTDNIKVAARNKTNLIFSDDQPSLTTQQRFRSGASESEVSIDHGIYGSLDLSKDWIPSSLENDTFDDGDLEGNSASVQSLRPVDPHNHPTDWLTKTCWPTQSVTDDQLLPPTSSNQKIDQSAPSNNTSTTKVMGCDDDDQLFDMIQHSLDKFNAMCRGSVERSASVNICCNDRLYGSNSEAIDEAVARSLDSQVKNWVTCSVVGECDPVRVGGPDEMSCSQFNQMAAFSNPVNLLSGEVEASTLLPATTSRRRSKTTSSFEVGEHADAAGGFRSDCLGDDISSSRDFRSNNFGARTVAADIIGDLRSTQIGPSPVWSSLKESPRWKVASPPHPTRTRSTTFSSPSSATNWLVSQNFTGFDPLTSKPDKWRSALNNDDIVRSPDKTLLFDGQCLAPGQRFGQEALIGDGVQSRSLPSRALFDPTQNGDRNFDGFDQQQRNCLHQQQSQPDQILHQYRQRSSYSESASFANGDFHSSRSTMPNTKPAPPPGLVPRYSRLTRAGGSNWPTSSLCHELNQLTLATTHSDESGEAAFAARHRGGGGLQPSFASNIDFINHSHQQPVSVLKQQSTNIIDNHFQSSFRNLHASPSRNPSGGELSSFSPLRHRNQMLEPLLSFSQQSPGFFQSRQNALFNPTSGPHSSFASVRGASCVPGTAHSGRPVVNKARRACSFYLRGHCKKEDCEFAHDLSKVTCKFWQVNECFKGVACQFLHGYPSSDEE